MSATLPLVQAEPWMAAAACAKTDSDLWFPERSKSGGSIAAAKAICNACPVRDECLEYALAHREHYGIWGGTTERERRTLARHRRHTTAAQPTRRTA